MIEKLIKKIFNIKGGFEQGITRSTILNRKGLYIKTCNNGWYLFIEILLGHKVYQVSLWNYYKYREEYIDRINEDDTLPTCDNLETN